MHRLVFPCFAAAAFAPLVSAESVAAPVAESGAAAARAALIAGVERLPVACTSGDILLTGEHAFALVANRDLVVPAAAGLYGDKPDGGRVVVFAHDGLHGFGNPLLANAATWAARGNAAPVVALLSDDLRRAEALTKAGAKLKSVETPADLTGCDLVYLHQDNRLGEAAWCEAIAAHLRRGGGLIVASTTWALSEPELIALNTLLAPAGLRAHDSVEVDRLPLAPAPAASGVPRAVAALRSGARPGPALRVLEKYIRVTNDTAVVRDLLAEHRRKTPFLTPTPAAPWVLDADPVGDLRLLAESKDFAALPPDKLFAHPAHRGFPGACLPGARPVTRTLTVRVESPPASAPVSEAERGTWIETGLYAEAGQPVTVTLPAALVGQGLRVMIGTHDDIVWRDGNATREYRRAPKVTRDARLESGETTLGCVYGGLVRLNVPAGAALGEHPVTISGAVESPVYTLGKTTPAQWVDERAKPGAQAVLQVYGLTLYIPSEKIRSADVEVIARHWDTVMRTGDDWLAVGKLRRRPELIMEDVQVSWGLHYAGYPVMLGADDRSPLLPNPEVAAGGDWGVYHELGHTYQMNYHGDYNIATHYEVEVNLLPGILYQKIWDKTAWDGPVHSTYDAQSRLADRKAFEKLPPGSRTWKTACEGTAVAYDFHFAIAEAFGWGVWRDTLTRLGAWKLNPAADPEFSSLDEGDEEQRKRDRLFVGLCRASGHNLKPWFNRFGLGRGEFPLGKKALAAVEALPKWNGNRPVSRIEGPVRVSSASARPDAVLAAYKAVDPDAGEVFEWDIFSGNSDGAFSIGKRTGVLTAETAAAGPRTLVLRVRDCGVPRTEKRISVSVQP